MQRVLTLAMGISVVALIAACQDPIAGHATPIPLPPQIEMTTAGLANDTALPPPVIARVPGTGQLLVNVNVQNRTNDYMVLEYQYQFTDHGIQKQDWTGWMPLRIPPRADGTVQLRSMEPEVDDFRVRFRRARLE